MTKSTQLDSEQQTHQTTTHICQNWNSHLSWNDPTGTEGFLFSYLWKTVPITGINMFLIPGRSKFVDLQGLSCTIEPYGALTLMSCGDEEVYDWELWMQASLLILGLSSSAAQTIRLSTTTVQVWPRWT
jgi:hypothetical protein